MIITRVLAKSWRRGLWALCFLAHSGCGGEGGDFAFAAFKTPMLGGGTGWFLGHTAADGFGLRPVPDVFSLRPIEGGQLVAIREDRRRVVLLDSAGSELRALGNLPAEAVADIDSVRSAVVSRDLTGVAYWKQLTTLRYARLSGTAPITIDTLRSVSSGTLLQPQALSFSPDGSAVVYADDVGNPAVRRAPIDGSGASFLVPPSDLILTTFAPDGTLFAANGGSLFRIPAGGGPRTDITPYPGKIRFEALATSQDSSRVVFWSATPADPSVGGFMHFYSVAAAGMGERDVAHFETIGANWAPSPEGDAILASWGGTGTAFLGVLGANVRQRVEGGRSFEVILPLRR